MTTISEYRNVIDVFAAFEAAGVDDIDPVDFAVRYLIGVPASVTVSRELARQVFFTRRGVEDYEYVGTGCFEDVEISGVITQVRLDERGQVAEVVLDPDAGSESVIDGDAFDDMVVAYNPFAAWRI